MPTDNAILGITWNGGRLVAVGSHGTLATSRDDVSWDLRVLWEEDDYEDVARSGKTYVALAVNGNTAASPDGLAWTREAETAAIRRHRPAAASPRIWGIIPVPLDLLGRRGR